MFSIWLMSRYSKIDIYMVRSSSKLEDVEMKRCDFSELPVYKLKSVFIYSFSFFRWMQKNKCLYFRQSFSILKWYMLKNILKVLFQLNLLVNTKLIRFSEMLRCKCWIQWNFLQFSIYWNMLLEKIEFKKFLMKLNFEFNGFTNSIFESKIFKIIEYFKVSAIFESIKHL